MVLSRLQTRSIYLNLDFYFAAVRLSRERLDLDLENLDQDKFSLRTRPTLL